MVSRGACVGVHALEELQEDSSCERRHVLGGISKCDVRNGNEEG